MLNLAHIIGDFAKAATRAAGARTAAQSAPKRKGAECTPCAAAAYVENTKRELAGKPVRKGRR